MPIETRYVDDQGVLLILWDGRVTREEWEAVARDQLTDESGWHNGRRRLIDLSTCDPSALRVTDIDELVGLWRRNMSAIAGRRQAIVAPLAWDLAVEFARQSQPLGATTIVFDHLEPAARWLRVDHDAVRTALVAMRAELHAR